MIVTICSGGNLGEWALLYLKQADYIVGVDQGAHFVIEHGLVPNIAMGDFDSVSNEQYERIKEASLSFVDYDAIDKDYTDTQLAVLHALELKPQRILLVGALGTRFDHSLSTIYLLELALKHRIAMSLIDEHNMIQLIDHTYDLTIQRAGYRYVSLLPYSAEVTNIKLQGFKYPLTDTPLSLTKGLSIGISNELLDEEGILSVESGQLLVIQAND